MLKSIPDTNIAFDIIPDSELVLCRGQQVHIKSNMEFLKANKRSINFNIIKFKIYLKNGLCEALGRWEENPGNYRGILSGALTGDDL